MKRVLVLFTVAMLLLPALAAATDVLVGGWWNGDMEALQTARNQISLKLDEPVTSYGIEGTGNMNILLVGWENATSDELISARKQLDEQIHNMGGELPAVATPVPTYTPMPTYTPAPEVTPYEVVNEYQWNTDWYNYWGIVIKNTSGNTCGFSAQIILYDADNNIIGVKNGSIDVLADGYEGYIGISNTDAFDHVAYNISETSTRYYEVQSFVDVQASKSGKKAIIIATNNGSVAAEFVEYHVLFLNKGEVVGSGWGYLTDDDSEIKPGKMEMREETCFEEFDQVEIYFDGRCY